MTREWYKGLANNVNPKFLLLFVHQRWEFLKYQSYLYSHVENISFWTQVQVRYEKSSTYWNPFSEKIRVGGKGVIVLPPHTLLEFPHHSYFTLIRTHSKTFFHHFVTYLPSIEPGAHPTLEPSDYLQRTEPLERHSGLMKETTLDP